MSKAEYSMQWCKYTYSQEELKDIAEKLAISTQALEELESEKKAVASSYKERIESAQNDIRGAARRYKDGYEMRNIECEVARDYDAGVIRYVRTDNGEVACETKMTVAERQLTLDQAMTPDSGEEAPEEAGEPQDQETEEEAEENDGYDGLPENLTKYLKDKEGRGTSRKTRATQ